MLEKDFNDIIKNIKDDVRKTQIKTMYEVNSNLIMLYFRLGKILNDNYKYGNKFIEEVAHELKIEYPNSKGYSVRNLKYMKKFYLEYKDDELMQRCVAQVPWRHNIVLMSKYGWSKDMLLIQIENNYHLRIGSSDKNFKKSLSNDESDLANNIVKDPYIF